MMVMMIMIYVLRNFRHHIQVYHFSLSCSLSLFWIYEMRLIQHMLMQITLNLTVRTSLARLTIEWNAINLWYWRWNVSILIQNIFISFHFVFNEKCWTHLDMLHRVSCGATTIGWVLWRHVRSSMKRHPWFCHTICQKIISKIWHILNHRFRSNINSYGPSIDHSCKSTSTHSKR